MLPSMRGTCRRPAESAVRALTTTSLTSSSQRPLIPAATERPAASKTSPWVCQSYISRCFSNSATTAGSSSSKARWLARQINDPLVREAKVMQLKSRAAFKLLEIDSKHRLFKPNQTIVDLGYAPGSWSQVAVERTKPNGRVIGIDLIPAQPPRGVSTIQGNFLSLGVREMVKELLAKPPASLKTPAVSRPNTTKPHDNQGAIFAEPENDNADQDGTDAVAPEGPNDTVAVDQLSYLASERQAAAAAPVHDPKVDIVLSDMSEPWPQTYGFWLKTMSNPYDRMMNTSGNAFRDHAGSMDLCLAALEFACDTLRTGGYFVCKFYQGGEDKAFEMRLKKIFTKVVREKPDSSRSESKESFFVALGKKKGVKWDDIKDM